MPFFSGMAPYEPGDYYCIDINSKGLVSELCDNAIRYFTHSDYCHTVIITSAAGDIVEARPHGGVTKGNMSEYKDMNVIPSSTNLTAEQRVGIVNFVNNLVGKDSYNFTGVCALGLYLKGARWNWLENRVASEAAEDRQTFCSQLAAMAGRANGVKEWMCGFQYATLVTPGDLASLALGDTFGVM